MNNKIWMTLVGAAFLAGYFIRGFDSNLQLPLTATETSQSSSSLKAANTGNLTEEDLAVVESPVASVTNNTHSLSSKSSSSRSSILPQGNTATQASQATSTETASSLSASSLGALSDEEIDKLLSAPFNASLKRAPDSLKQKYKDFIEPNRKDDWDMRMQGQLTDFVLSRPYAADIVIESLLCNANMCEVRLHEHKRFLLMGLFGDLMQQPWFANQVDGTVDFQPDGSDGCYILMRKKN